MLTDRQTDRHDEANSRFFESLRTRLKITLLFRKRIALFEVMAISMSLEYRWNDDNRRRPNSGRKSFFFNATLFIINLTSTGPTPNPGFHDGENSAI